MTDVESVLECVAAPASSALPLPHALLLFAHPDDEVIALGGRMERFTESRFLCVTDGALRDIQVSLRNGFESREAYAAGRRKESEDALRHAGVSSDVLRYLAIDEGVRIIVDLEAALDLVALTRAVERELHNFALDVILTHPYEGGHPDHDSCSFAAQTAVRLIVGKPAPLVIEAPFYNNYSDKGSFGERWSEFLMQDTAIRVRDLSPLERKNKLSRLACFSTQLHIVCKCSVEHEQYRIAPAYDFTQPPHPNPLLYETWKPVIHDEQFNGEKFRTLAHAALRELGLA